MRILILIFSSIFFLPLTFGDCPANYTFGDKCQYTCPNCSLGCDVGGSCYNGLCIIGFYGTGCRENNSVISTPPTLLSTNCVVRVAADTFTTSFSNIGNFVYYVVYGPSNSAPSMDYKAWPSKMPLNNNRQADVTIPGGTYMFGIYFDFMDIKYSEIQQSLVSPTASATCNNSSNLPTATVSTTTTTTATTKFTGTTLSTPSTPSTASTASTTTTKSTVTVSSNSPQGLYYSNKTATLISLRWSPPLNNVNVSYYKVTVMFNNTFYSTSNTSTPIIDITGLQPGNRYNITVTTIYALSSISPANSLITICTDPTPNILIEPLKILNIGRKSMDVVFPADNTKYSCSVNIYRIAAIPINASPSRRKRDVSSNSKIPSGTILKWNSSQFPLTLPISDLNSAINYTLYAEIYTNVNGTENYYYSITNQATNGPSDGAIAGIIIGILLFLLLLILLILLCIYRKRKQKPLKNQSYENYSNPLKDIVTDGKPLSSAYWSGINDKMEPRYLMLNPNEWSEDLRKAKAPSFTNQNYCPDGLRFIDEYNNLPEDSPYSHIAAEANYVKNKKQDIFPYDHNRVKLRRKIEKNQTDYINASFIDGYLRKKAYITSQSPFDDETINDFWMMIYEQNVGQIIMLTETEFGNVTKSSVYWPQINSKYLDEAIYGTISVKIINEINYAFYDIREFEIKDNSYMVEPQLVKQYHFRGWPHNDTPQNSIAFLDFYQTIKVSADISNGPLLVHCGTGISQSAVFIAFDILNTQVIHENCVNVFRTVAQLRRSRYKMVNNSKHYMFIYDLLFESILCGQFIIKTNVRKIYKLLSKKNPQSGYDYLHEQFYLLQTYHMVTTCKNQNAKDISFMDSIEYTQNLSSLASPIANNEKIEEFWNTVFNNKIEVIIDLRTTDDSLYYMIENMKGLELSLNEVSTLNESFRRFQISLHNKETRRSVDISLYQLGTPWLFKEDINEKPENNDSVVWVELIYHILQNHSHQTILAHCVHGWSKSGLFLTCYNVAAKIFKSKYVMVYNVVRAMKFYRYEFVTSFAQFDFIFIFLKKWVELKMSNEDYDEDNLPGLLESGDKLTESLFTHEQTPVLRPEQKQIYAPLGSRKYYGSYEEDLLVVHYNLSTSSELMV